MPPGTRAKGAEGKVTSSPPPGTFFQNFKSRLLLLTQISANMPASSRSVPWPSSCRWGPPCISQTAQFHLLFITRKPSQPYVQFQVYRLSLCWEVSTGPVPSICCRTPSAQKTAWVAREAFAELVNDPSYTTGACKGYRS